ncbi:hypothetical protein HXX76_006626 [Chlamydomonas incerta]|uniref:Uncharacterized protein n=1 Tax=Chlamydomonas incerta TaxID=51695 RepID=A0A835W1Z3_CHLIN|nr:hypothetical protein HXX76_006626 [Chlamydomonas incerta]|eukprot:KAG2436315.1 hypothetical protein HXX76_006626 [Chlamydomonas incerta]
MEGTNAAGAPPAAPREDLSLALRNLPPGTLSGLDALCDHAFWLTALRQAEVGISNEDIFRFRFQEICKAASSRLAFLAGSGEYTSFNMRYLIMQLVEQCEDMHSYTRRLEKYVVKLQKRVESLEAEQLATQAEQAAAQAEREQQHQQQLRAAAAATAAAVAVAGTGQAGAAAASLPAVKQEASVEHSKRRSSASAETGDGEP